MDPAIYSLPATVRTELQLLWLARIRWSAIIALLIIFCGADYLLGLDLSWLVIVGALSLSALSNVILMLSACSNPRESSAVPGVALLIDVLVLSTLLYISGGYSNPFSMMFLVYVTLASFFLSSGWAWGIFSISLVAFSTLFFLHIPAHQFGGHSHHGVSGGLSLHLQGMLLAFAVIGFITAWFVTRMSRELSAQSEQIADLRESQIEKDKLLALATLTAGAAHELATPIATLSLIGEDLGEAFATDPRWQEDMGVLRAELNRCGEILNRMRGASPDLRGELPTDFSIAAVVERLRSEFPDGGVVTFECPTGESDTIRSFREGLVSALHALLRNAVQACASAGHVVCKAIVDEASVSFEVLDSGSGMSEEVRRRAGEPFFTSKEPGEGMGLGLYVTKLFALRVGGELRISSEVGRGSCVSLRIPRVARV